MYTIVHLGRQGSMILYGIAQPLLGFLTCVIQRVYLMQLLLDNRTWTFEFIYLISIVYLKVDFGLWLVWRLTWTWSWIWNLNFKFEFELNLNLVHKVEPGLRIYSMVVQLRNFYVKVVCMELELEFKTWIEYGVKFGILFQLELETSIETWPELRLGFKKKI